MQEVSIRFAGEDYFGVMVAFLYCKYGDERGHFWIAKYNVGFTAKHRRGAPANTAVAAIMGAK